MMELKIKLETMKDAAMFVTKMENVAGDAVLKRGNQIVDAKSLIGVLQLGVGRESVLTLHGEQDQDALRDLLKDYIV